MLIFDENTSIILVMNDTICAISTPLGRGAISIVRMSGKNSLDIMRKLFSSKNLDYDKIMPRYLYLGNFQLDKGVEHCLAVYFKSPFSYTGEDMVEFQVHGGSILTQSVLNKLLENGVRLAESGEFTKRAFENGKLSLDMAESVIGEINAESEAELNSVLGLAEGRLTIKIRSLQSNLTECLAEIEATLDYPEEDFEELAKQKIFKNIENVQKNIKICLENAKNARILTQGINIAIVGAPNVGKSSTLNALVGQDRAIVTDIEGTTRDTLTESISYKGIKLNFIDTAGIRESKDVVEKIGIEKSKKSIDNADVVIFMLDGSREMNEFDRQIESILNGKNNVINIINKSDLPRKLKNLQKNDEIIEISALNEENIEKIKELIYSKVLGEEIDYNKTLITSTRHIEALKEADSICEEISKSKNSSMDIIAMLIKNVWNALGKITGESENEDIIDLIFSKFCLGK